MATFPWNRWQLSSGIGGNLPLEYAKLAIRREHVREAVVLTFERFKKRYGAPRIHVELNEAGIDCSLNHIAKLMAQSGLKARNGKGFRYSPSNNMFTHVSDNLLKRNFKADRPNEKWVSDITYCVFQ